MFLIPSRCLSERLLLESLLIPVLCRLLLFRDLGLRVRSRPVRPLCTLDVWTVAHLQLARVHQFAATSLERLYPVVENFVTFLVAYALLLGDCVWPVIPRREFLARPF